MYEERGAQSLLHVFSNYFSVIAADYSPTRLTAVWNEFNCPVFKILPACRNLLMSVRLGFSLIDCTGVWSIRMNEMKCKCCQRQMLCNKKNFFRLDLFYTIFQGYFTVFCHNNSPMTVRVSNINDRAIFCWETLDPGFNMDATSHKPSALQTNHSPHTTKTA